MAMNTHPIRFPDDIWAAVEIAAEKDGMSKSEIVRIGTLSYVAFMAARRGDPATAGFERLWDAANELLRVYPL